MSAKTPDAVYVHLEIGVSRELLDIADISVESMVFGVVVMDVEILHAV